MAKTACPGQDTRFWQPGDIFDVNCGECDAVVEFFKDDATRRCMRCGSRIQNPRLNLGCAQWCEHAEDCLGYDPRGVGEDEGAVALIDKLIQAVKEEFGEDQGRISHALSVLERSQEILRKESASPRVVLAASLLHDIGIVEAERKHGSSSAKYQEIEGPPIAKRIMQDLGLDVETVDHVCRIVGSHHSAKEIDTPEFRVVWDADWLVNIPEELQDADGETLQEKIDQIFRTGTGREKAYELYVRN